ncbi:hypothetical protein FRC12_012160 [Ceratobasidium sp. 428]|nr:hypothetical protein FRC12_012160 [Ceratobasidium sp. 428]
MFDGQPIWPVAFMTALPAILATYSSFALLAGLVAMIVQGPGETVATKTRPYIALAVVPVATTFLGLLFVIGLCEYGTYLERSKRKEAKARKNPTKPKGQENKRPAILNALPSLSYIFPWASPAASAPGNPSAKLEKPEERAPQHESV